jgi:hypothetical protein
MNQGMLLARGQRLFNKVLHPRWNWLGRRRWRLLAGKTVVRSGDPASLSREFKKILILMLDQFQDPAGARPALFRLRQAFRDSHITLVCGSNNEIMAGTLEVADRLIVFDVFHPRTGAPLAAPPELFDRVRGLVGGDYDLAIDLRVEGDSRFLLEVAENALKCGIGARWRFPYLDILLPGPDELEAQTIEARTLPIGAWRFRAHSPQDNPFVISIDLSTARGHVIYGPYLKLPAESYRVTFQFEVEGLGDQPIQQPFTFEIAPDRVPSQEISLGAAERDVLRSGRVSLPFDVRSPEQEYEFRVLVPDKPFDGTLRFHGVTLERTDYQPRRVLDRTDYLWFLAELICFRLDVTHARQYPENFETIV